MRLGCNGHPCNGGPEGAAGYSRDTRTKYLPSTGLGERGLVGIDDGGII